MRDSNGKDKIIPLQA